MCDGFCRSGGPAEGRPYSPIDIQHIFPTGDRARIEVYAQEMIDRFACDSSGLIAKNYGDLHGIGVEPEWDMWAYQVFVDHGRLI